MNRDRTILIVAGLSGVLAFFLILHQMGEAKKPATRIAVVTRTAPKGTVLTKDMLVYSAPIKGLDPKDFAKADQRKESHVLSAIFNLRNDGLAELCVLGQLLLAEAQFHPFLLNRIP